MKVMGALLLPLYQNSLRMIEAGLLTDIQYRAGKEELLDKMSCFHAMSSDCVAITAGEASGGNKWDNQDMHFLDGIAAPRKKAEREYDAYLAYTHGMFQPTMKGNCELGFINKEGSPQELIYLIGCVTEAGKNLPSKRNHAEYIDGAGNYNIAK